MPAGPLTGCRRAANRDGTTTNKTKKVTNTPGNCLVQYLGSSKREVRSNVKVVMTSRSVQFSFAVGFSGRV